MPDIKLSEDDFDSTTKSPVAKSAITKPAITKPHDKVNNTTQKEASLFKAGVTREKAFRIVAEALEAVIIEQYRDEQMKLKYRNVPNIELRKWAAEMTAKYFGDLVTKQEDNSNGIRQLIIIRPDEVEARRGEATEAQALPRPVRFQSKSLPGDVQFLGNGQDNVVDISGHVIQRADTK